MKNIFLTFILLFGFLFCLFGQSKRVIINFEDSEIFNPVTGTNAVDAAALDNTLYNSAFHVNFSVGSLNSSNTPIYAKAGGSFLAFFSITGHDCQGLTATRNYIKDDVTNCFFITDDEGTIETEDADIFIDVDQNYLIVNRFNMDLLDVDTRETVLVDVYAVGISGVYERQTFISGDPGTGNSVALNVSFDLENEDIDYIHVHSEEAFLGIDNIIFEKVDPCRCDLDVSFLSSVNCTGSTCVYTYVNTSSSNEPIISALWVLVNQDDNSVVDAHWGQNATVCIDGTSCSNGVDLVASPNTKGYQLCLYVEDAAGCISKACNNINGTGDGFRGQNAKETIDERLVANVILAPTPNPFKNQMSLNFELTRAGNASINLYNSNMSLKEVIKPNSKYAKGSHTLEWNSDDHLDAGVYFIEFVINNGKETIKKVVHVK